MSDHTLALLMAVTVVSPALMNSQDMFAFTLARSLTNAVYACDHSAAVTTSQLTFAPTQARSLSLATFVDASLLVLMNANATAVFI